MARLRPSKIVSKPASVMGCRLFLRTRGLSTGIDMRGMGKDEFVMLTYIMRSLIADE